MSEAMGALASGGPGPFVNGAQAAAEPTADALAQGRRLFEQLHGGHAGERLVESLASICPDFARMTFEWAHAGVLARPGLDLGTRQLLVIAGCVTLGHALPQLRAHIEAALRVGVSREQVVEAILQLLFYAGGAATANGLLVAGEVFAQLDAAPAPGATI